MEARGSTTARRLAWAGAGLGAGALGLVVARRLRMKDVHGATALISGGSRGLGFTLAEELGRHGARLALCARDEEELEEARKRLAGQGYEVMTIPADVANREEAQRVTRETVARFGRVDLLFNVASVIAAGPALGLTLDDLDRVMRENFWTTANLTYAVLPGMVERHEGRIVNIASIGGKVSVPHLLSYSTGKFAMVGFSEGLRAELAREGIKVTTVCPGLMRTGSYLNAQFKGAPPSEVAAFSLLDNIPGVSISAERAARQIVAAARRGSAELIISTPAIAASVFHGIFPGVTADLLALVDRFLVARPTPDTALRFGSEEQTAVTRSPLLRLGQSAVQRLNERLAISRRDGEEAAREAMGEVSGETNGKTTGETPSASPSPAPANA